MFTAINISLESVSRKHCHNSSYPDYWKTSISVGIGMLEDARLVTGSGPTKFDIQAPPPPPFLLPPPPLPSHSNECHFDSCGTPVGYHYLPLMSVVVAALGLGILASRTTIWRRRRLCNAEPSCGSQLRLYHPILQLFIYLRCLLPNASTALSEAFF